MIWGNRYGDMPTVYPQQWLSRMSQVGAESNKSDPLSEEKIGED